MAEMTPEECALCLDDIGKAAQKASYVECVDKIMGYALGKIRSSVRSHESPSGKPWLPRAKDGKPAGDWVAGTIVRRNQTVVSTSPYAIYLHSRRRRVKASVGIKFGAKFRARKVTIKRVTTQSRPIMPGMHLPKAWDLKTPYMKALQKALGKLPGKYKMQWVG